MREIAAQIHPNLAAFYILLMSKWYSRHAVCSHNMKCFISAGVERRGRIKSAIKDCPRRFSHDA